MSTNTKRLKNLETLCRVCLTQSKSMVSINCVLDDKNPNSDVIGDVLENVMGAKLNHTIKYPSVICAMCLGLLKISNDLKQQFLNTQQVLLTYNGDFGQTSGVSNESKSFSEDETKSCPVELIVGKNKYDLNDILIVEDDQDIAENYKGFLDNLGTTVTAKFVDKNYKYNKINDDEIEHEIILIEKDQRNINNKQTEENVLFEFTNDIDFSNLNGEDLVDVNQYIIAAGAYRPETTTMEQFGLENIPEEDKELFQSALRLQHQCLGCNKYYAKKGRLVSHMQTCEKLFKLQEQNDNKSSVVIVQEETTPSIKQYFYCLICKRDFQKEKNFKVHMRRVHNPEKKQYPCNSCDHISNTKSAATYHKLRHNGKQFECEICSKKFYTANTLKVHALNHLHIPQVLCPVCGKSFHYRSGLDYHMRIHTKERRYSCTYCDRNFYMLNSLKRHTRTHTGIRPYACSYCDKRFFSTGEARKHEMLHTGLRPYRCVYCKKGFTSKFNMQVHLMAHPGPHTCNYCDKTFIEIGYLKRHMETKHSFTEENTFLDE